MQNWLQRTAIWAVMGWLLYSLSITVSDLRFWAVFALLALLEYLAAQQGARAGMELILNLPQQRLQRLQALFRAAAAGAPVDKDAIRRILGKDE